MWQWRLNIIGEVLDSISIIKGEWRKFRSAARNERKGK